MLLRFKLWISKCPPTARAELICMCAVFCLNNIIVMSPTFAHTYRALEKALEMLKQFAVQQVWNCMPMVDSKFIIMHLN